MSRKAITRPSRSFWVALFVASTLAAGTSYAYASFTKQQTCVQEITTELLTCHDSKAGEHPGTTFVIKGRS